MHFLAIGLRTVLSSFILKYGIYRPIWKTSVIMVNKIIYYNDNKYKIISDWKKTKIYDLQSLYIT